MAALGLCRQASQAVSSYSEQASPGVVHELPTVTAALLSEHAL